MEKNKMKKIVLDGSILADEEKVHRYLKEKFSFSEYYGGNLDALYDCLTELKDMEIVVNAVEKKTPYLQKILRVFETASKESEGSITFKYNENGTMTDC